MSDKAIARNLGKLLKLSTIRRQKMEYKIGDQELSAAAFIGFANKVWPGRYNEEKTAAALSKTLNITAYDGETLVGCLRILTLAHKIGKNILKYLITE